MEACQRPRSYVQMRALLAASGTWMPVPGHQLSAVDLDAVSVPTRAGLPRAALGVLNEHVPHRQADRHPPTVGVPDNQGIVGDDDDLSSPGAPGR